MNCSCLGFRWYDVPQAVQTENRWTANWKRSLHLETVSVLHVISCFSSVGVYSFNTDLFTLIGKWYNSLFILRSSFLRVIYFSQEFTRFIHPFEQGCPIIVRKPQIQVVVLLLQARNLITTTWKINSPR